MIELGVNIDHVATLRQARRTWEPDPVWAAVEAHLGGADGITIHLREDRRHINDEDVRRLAELTQVKLNLEMAATDEMVAIACRTQPQMAMLVPEGASCLSLGTRTPLADIRSAAVGGGFDIVGLSFSIAYPARQAIEGLLELRSLLPEGIELWAGGAAVRDKQKRLPGIRVVGDLEDTMAALQEWRARNGAEG